MHDWNEKEIGDLRRMCAEGCTARVIADWLGTTRNSVIGKLTRLGLHCTVPERPPPKRKRKPAQPKPSHPWVPRPRVRFREPSHAKHGQPELHSAPCLITELTEDACHWPMWRNDERDIRAKLYCGGMAVEGSSYCPHHAWLNARGAS
jgi:GcrA cell cycle regulator